MTDADDAELRALRERVYGRAAGIRVDPSDVARLRQLESELPLSQAVVAGTPVNSETVRPTVDLGSEDEGIEPALAPADLSRRPRRSPVLVAAGCAAAVVVALAAVTLVQRVQTDPLQIGAHQVARLSEDPTYRIPSVVSGIAVDSNVRPKAFDEFHGLRIVSVTAGQTTRQSGADRCLAVFPAASVKDADSSSFTGLLIFGCGAGGFPATIQFRTDSSGLPEQLRRAFPKSRALQLVYDEADNEVVVFSDQ